MYDMIGREELLSKGGRERGGKGLEKRGKVVGKESGWRGVGSLKLPAWLEGEGGGSRVWRGERAEEGSGVRGGKLDTGEKDGMRE